jgi:5-methylcytosine-specific restriction endonuclease McrA
MDNRISHFTSQWGKCAVTCQAFQTVSDIHCHHKNPRHLGGNDRYDNLVLVCENVHQLIHAVQPETIAKYKAVLKLNHTQLKKLNELRKMAKLPPV